MHVPDDLDVVKHNNGLYTYHDFNYKAGGFNYTAYRSIQAQANVSKLDRVWVMEENIRFISEYIGVTMNPKFALCHGTRQGKEQEWFMKYVPGCSVLGTEIADTAEQFPNTIYWDFHDVKPEWVNSVDFIYSNSIDHSYNPVKCLQAWMRCVKIGGVCILEHYSDNHPDKASPVDPFGIYLYAIPYFVLVVGGGDYSVVNILDAPVRKAIHDYDCFVIIKKFKHSEEDA